MEEKKKRRTDSRFVFLQDSCRWQDVFVCSVENRSPPHRPPTPSFPSYTFQFSSLLFKRRGSLSIPLTGSSSDRLLRGRPGAARRRVYGSVASLSQGVSMCRVQWRGVPTASFSFFLSDLGEPLVA